MHIDQHKHKWKRQIKQIETVPSVYIQRKRKKKKKRKLYNNRTIKQAHTHQLRRDKDPKPQIKFLKIRHIYAITTVFYPFLLKLDYFTKICEKTRRMPGVFAKVRRLTAGHRWLKSRQKIAEFLLPQSCLSNCTRYFIFIFGLPLYLGFLAGI